MLGKSSSFTKKGLGKILGYLPYWFVISNSDISVNESLIIVPSYELRRSFSKILYNNFQNYFPFIFLILSDCAGLVN
jgi:hypothetical protein